MKDCEDNFNKMGNLTAAVDRLEKKHILPKNAKTKFEMANVFYEEKDLFSFFFLHFYCGSRLFLTVFYTSVSILHKQRRFCQ